MLIASIGVWLISAVLAYLLFRWKVNKTAAWTTEDRFEAIIIGCVYGPLGLTATCIWCIWPDKDTPARW